jgi:hypothetical protein
VDPLSPSVTVTVPATGVGVRRGLGPAGGEVVRAGPLEAVPAAVARVGDAADVATAVATGVATGVVMPGRINGSWEWGGGDVEATGDGIDGAGWDSC